jgi:hypothetical protein
MLKKLIATLRSGNKKEKRIDDGVDIIKHREVFEQYAREQDCPVGVIARKVLRDIDHRAAVLRGGDVSKQ